MAHHNSEPFDLSRIDIPMDAIKALPAKTRRVFHLAGHIANEINELHRLGAITIKQDDLPDPLTKIAVGRGWVILRVLIGKTYEAGLFVGEHLKETGDFYKEYLLKPLTDPGNPFKLGKDHLEAYGKVCKRLSDQRGLLNSIRNKIAFHYKLEPYLDQGFDGLDDSWDQALFWAGSNRHQSRHASFNSGAENVVVRAMLQKAIETGDLASDSKPDLGKAMEELADTAMDSAGEIADLMEALILCILKVHEIRKVSTETRLMSLSHVPSIYKFRIPPFLK